MDKLNSNRKILFIGAIILIAILIGGIIYANIQKGDEEYEFPPPEKVVVQYFESWSAGDYSNMYATLSDGFKEIEPTAKDLRVFKEYVEIQNINGIEIVNINEISNDEKTAVVEYKVNFILEDSKKEPYSGSFTLKYREADVIRGWKLIHPYGENIDDG